MQDNFYIFLFFDLCLAYSATVLKILFLCLRDDVDVVPQFSAELFAFLRTQFIGIAQLPI